MVKPGKTALSFSQALEITKKLFLKARLLS
jgi:hypothetical protein